MDYIWAFIVGGLICVIGQILMDMAKIAPLMSWCFCYYRCNIEWSGSLSTLLDFGKAGASIPLTGFGHTLVTGVIEDINEYGIFGILAGGLRTTAAGITAAIVFGYLMAVIFNPKSK